MVARGICLLFGWLAIGVPFESREFVNRNVTSREINVYPKTVNVQAGLRRQQLPPTACKIYIMLCSGNVTANLSELDCMFNHCQPWQCKVKRARHASSHPGQMPCYKNVLQKHLMRWRRMPRREAGDGAPVAEKW